MIKLDIDMPRNCLDCPFHYTDNMPMPEFGTGIYRVYLLCKFEDLALEKFDPDDEPDLTASVEDRTRPDWCPLTEADG